MIDLPFYCNGHRGTVRWDQFKAFMKEKIYAAKDTIYIEKDTITKYSAHKSHSSLFAALSSRLTPMHTSQNKV